MGELWPDSVVGEEFSRVECALARQMIVQSSELAVSLAASGVFPQYYDGTMVI